MIGDRYRRNGTSEAKDNMTRNLALDDIEFDEPTNGLLPISGGHSNPAEISAVTIDETGKHRPPRRSNRSGDVLYLDIETVPDDSRVHLFPLEPMPPITPFDKLISISEFASLTVEKSKDYLAKLSPAGEWIDAAEANELNSSKPRKEILKLLADKRSAQDDRIKELSVNPMFCRIVAIGLKVGSNPVESLLCSTPLDEYTALVEAWRVIQKHRPVIGFNVRDFDLRVMLVRSALLGVEPAFVPDTRKYGSPDVIDLMQAIYGDRCPKGCGLKPTARMFGIEVPEGHGDGSQVYKLFQLRKWGLIADYLVGDVELTAAVHQKIAGTLCQ